MSCDGIKSLFSEERESDKDVSTEGEGGFVQSCTLHSESNSSSPLLLSEGRSQKRNGKGISIFSPPAQRTGPKSWRRGRRPTTFVVAVYLDFFPFCCCGKKNNTVFPTPRLVATVVQREHICAKVPLRVSKDDGGRPFHPPFFSSHDYVHTGLAFTLMPFLSFGWTNFSADDDGDEDCSPPPSFPSSFWK